MGEDCGTWVPQVHFDWQSPNLSPSRAPFDAGKQSGVSTDMNPGTMPPYASSGLPHLQFGHSNEPHGWFYCLPRFRQGFTPATNVTTEEKLPAGHVEGFVEKIRPDGESGFLKKKFMVVDQTADRTTLIFSSRFGNPVEYPPWNSKLHGYNNLNEKEPLRRDLNLVVEPVLDDDKAGENQGTGIESEMHEDTEEINALLYSDSDGYSTEDDEVTSTGHSPSTMTTHDNREEPFRGTSEEVASSAGRMKKRKLFGGVYDDDMQFMDTASSRNNRNRTLDMGDDAESRCSNGNNSLGSGEMGSLPGNKKMRQEKIQGVLSILQNMIPGGKDMDPIELIDEAIRCLKSLKLKAKALGFDAL